MLLIRTFDPADFHQEVDQVYSFHSQPIHLHSLRQSHFLKNHSRVSSWIKKIEVKHITCD